VLSDASLSRPNTIVCPGGQMDLAHAADLHADDPAVMNAAARHSPSDRVAIGVALSNTPAAMVTGTNLRAPRCDVLTPRAGRAYTGAARGLVQRGKASSGSASRDPAGGVDVRGAACA
jgi:hypothetical protein